MLSNLLFALIHFTNLYATAVVFSIMWHSYQEYKLEGIAELVELNLLDKIKNLTVDLTMLAVGLAAVFNLCFTLLHIYLVLQGFLN